MKRILVPVDFSPAMESVLALAREMACAFQAELHLVHVREGAALPVFPATIGYPGMGMPEMTLTGGMGMVPPLVPDEPPNEKQRGQLEALAQDLTRRGIGAFAHERDGAVVEEILGAADDLAVNLVVIGSHGHSAVYNLLVGSVTEGVLKANRRPVLVVPTRPAAE